MGNKGQRSKVKEIGAEYIVLEGYMGEKYELNSMNTILVSKCSIEHYDDDLLVKDSKITCRGRIGILKCNIMRKYELDSINTIFVSKC